MAMAPNWVVYVGAAVGAAVGGVMGYQLHSPEPVTPAACVRALDAADHNTAALALAASLALDSTDAVLSGDYDGALRYLDEMGDQLEQLDVDNYEEQAQQCRKEGK